MNLLRRAIIQSAGFNLAENFATTIYSGNSVNDRAVNTGINSVSKESLLWTKCRTNVTNHWLSNTITGINSQLCTNLGDAEFNETNQVQSFTSTGYTLGTSANVNETGRDYISYQLAKSRGFFDFFVVSKSSSVESFAHDLGVEVGHMAVKSLAVDNWFNWHKGFTGDEYLNLNDTAITASSVNRWDSTAPTANNITLGSDFANGDYLVILYAHNPDSGISCLTRTGTGAAGNKQTTDYATGYLMSKSTSIIGNWALWDNQRDATNPNTLELKPNSTAAEASVANGVNMLSDGYDFVGGNYNNLGATYIDIVIADPTQF